MAPVSYDSVPTKIERVINELAISKEVKQK